MGAASIPEENFTDTCLEKQGKAFRSLEDLQEMISSLRFQGKVSLQPSMKKLAAILQSLSLCSCLEEKVLFPYAEVHLPKLQTLRFLYRAEEKDMLRNVRQLKHLAGKFLKTKDALKRQSLLEEIEQAGIYSLCLFKTHLQAEANLYHTLDTDLRNDEKAELWERIERHQGRGLCKEPH